MSENHPYDWAVAGPPLGVWKSALGSAAALMADTLTIAADGTGFLFLRSAFQDDVLDGGEGNDKVVGQAGYDSCTGETILSCEE